ncbi:Nse3p [Saccharomyces cerevisiae x Saccharomyces kudriavzevii VIN7]|uniref:Nse3p n=1 Tax=Saccharomyces cerevisiae x Saccharomyces kudriavzevii (strain VIN7) TaxID=1095631 RepID=H0GT34_SACCK|nr:Nse3p [Saccharomyces cerevisiae x Saccharomyces kudriavzevii VIN7]
MSSTDNDTDTDSTGDLAVLRIIRENPVARKAVRYVLSRAESQNSIITRNKLLSVIHDTAQEENAAKLSFGVMFMDINAILDNVYGFQLIGLPSKNNISTGGNSSNNNTNKSIDEPLGHRAQRFILLNNAPYLKNLDDFKLLQSVRTYDQLIVNGEYVGDDIGLESTNTLESKLSTDQDLVYKGVLSVVLCVIFFSKNNILHQELIKYLETFGIPSDGSKIPILNTPIEDLIKTLEKREYIAKLEEKSDTDGEVISYRIGRRTQAEFGLKSLEVLVQEIMGLEEGSE